MSPNFRSLVGAALTHAMHTICGCEKHVVASASYRVPLHGGAHACLQVAQASALRKAEALGSSTTVLTGWQKYVNCLLTKYGIDICVAFWPVLQCKRHIRRHVALLFANMLQMSQPR
jgi:hypothetical protein